MQLGVFAKTFPGTDPAQVLAACKAAHFDTVQYNMACSGLKAQPESISNEAAHHVAQASHATGVTISAISATYNMIDPDLERRNQGRGAFAAIAERALEMGANLVTVCTGSMDPHDKWRRHPANDDQSSWKEMCKEFELILERAERHDLLVGVEPEYANVVSTAQRAHRLLRSYEGSRLRIVFDPANLIEGSPPDQHQDTLDEALDLLGPAIALAHAKDRFADGQVAPAGSGTIDWDHVLRALKKTGFDGPVIAHGMSALQAPQVAKFLQQQIRQI